MVTAASARLVRVCGWRGRTLFDAYLRLPDGMGSHRLATESYVDLAEARGLPLPKTTKGWEHAGTEAGVRSEVQRCSSDAIHYVNGGWNKRRPDLFRILEPGMYGLREEVYIQAKILNFDSQSLLGVHPPIQRPKAKPDLFLTEFLPDQFDDQELYIDECVVPFDLGCRIIKIGNSVDDKSRRGQLQTGNPFPIRRRFVVRGYGVVELETKLLHMTKSNSMMGEWRWVTYADYDRIGGMIVRHNMEWP